MKIEKTGFSANAIYIFLQSSAFFLVGFFPFSFSHLLRHLSGISPKDIPNIEICNAHTACVNGRTYAVGAKIQGLSLLHQVTGSSIQNKQGLRCVRYKK